MPCPVLPAPCFRWAFARPFGSPIRLPTSWVAVSASTRWFPRSLPKKSWEGFVGGILGSVLIWLILWATHFYKLSLPYALLCGVVVSVLGVIGDLIESRIKRGVGVKDSGNLIPGHGGMLDRSDSLIFGCITAQLLLMIGGVL